MSQFKRKTEVPALTMKMAYNNARLISRPESDWLNTSLQVPAC